jgi:hypothetical protein
MNICSWQLLSRVCGKLFLVFMCGGVIWEVIFSGLNVPARGGIGAPSGPAVS